MRQRQPRVKNDTHLAFLRTLPCCVCVNAISTEAAHIRYSDASVGKFNAGVGQKPHDWFVVPLCGRCHREQHEAGDELAWWQSKNIDPLRVAMALYLSSGDHEAAQQIVACATHKFERAA